MNSILNWDNTVLSIKMKRQLILLAMLFVCIASIAQKKFSVYAIGFYNQENLFDTCHDAGKYDQDFLPTGSYHWDGLKYSHKLHNMARALADMGTDVLPNVGCAVIGLSEVENNKVLTDLTAQPELKVRNYQFCHIEGPDKRGIDCALIYNPSLFNVETQKLVPYRNSAEQDTSFATRGFLTITGTLANEPVAFVVCHLPSRYNGSSYREWGASQIKAVKDSLLALNPQIKVFVMGDMNDDPTDKSMHSTLSAKESVEKVGANDMYNPWYNILKKQGKGTLMYRGSWNLFDQIIMTPNLINKKGERNYTTLKFWKNQIQRMPYLFQQEGQYKGSPKRTSAGGAWLDGFSDHLPVCVYLIKEQQ